MNIDGIYDCVAKTPLGEQKIVITLKSEGNMVTGRAEGDIGGADIEDGRLDGNVFTWTMDVSKPMPMGLKGEVRIDGDSFTGSVKSMLFGEFPVTGTRRA